jgi:hypothetical protein
LEERLIQQEHHKTELSDHLQQPHQLFHDSPSHLVNSQQHLARTQAKVVCSRQVLGKVAELESKVTRAHDEIKARDVSIAALLRLRQVPPSLSPPPQRCSSRYGRLGAQLGWTSTKRRGPQNERDRATVKNPPIDLREVVQAVGPQGSSQEPTGNLGTVLAHLRELRSVRSTQTSHKSCLCKFQAQGPRSSGARSKVEALADVSSSDGGAETIRDKDTDDTNCHESRCLLRLYRV